MHAHEGHYCDGPCLSCLIPLCCFVLVIYYFSSKTTVFINILFISGGWVEDMVEDDGETEIFKSTCVQIIKPVLSTGNLAAELERPEDISSDPAFGPQSPSTPASPMTISQSHKKSWVLSSYFPNKFTQSMLKRSALVHHPNNAVSAAVSLFPFPLISQ